MLSRRLGLELADESVRNTEGWRGEGERRARQVGRGGITYTQAQPWLWIHGLAHIPGISWDGRCHAGLEGGGRGRIGEVGGSLGRRGWGLGCGEACELGSPPLLDERNASIALPVI